MLSKAFEIPRKTLLTLSPASNDSYISCVIDINWLMHESPGLKLDSLGEIELVSLKNLNIEYRFFKNLPQIGNSEMGQ